MNENTKGEQGVVDYVEIDFWGNLKEAIEQLQYYHRRKMKVKTNFNGNWLYSDKVDLENTYKEVTGKTYTEFRKWQQEEHEQYLREEAEHKAKIPELTKHYIEEGHKLIEEKYWELWDKCVPIRLDDLYKGWELDCCLEIIKALNENKSFVECKKIFSNQGHSGMSAGLMKSMLKSFHKDGEKLIEIL